MSEGYLLFLRVWLALRLDVPFESALEVRQHIELPNVSAERVLASGLSAALQIRYYVLAYVAQIHLNLQELTRIRRVKLSAK